MKRARALLLAAAGLAAAGLTAASATAATAYVSDELVLGVYAEQNGQGQRLATLHSGAAVETMAIDGEFTQVRLSEGTIGWVKTAYLTPKEPATVRIKQPRGRIGPQPCDDSGPGRGGGAQRSSSNSSASWRSSNPNSTRQERRRPRVRRAASRQGARVRPFQPACRIGPGLRFSQF